jgi:hypothetical protein
MTPQILLDMAQFLKESPIDIADSVEGEGRGGSLIDEGTVKRILKEKFPGRIKDMLARRFADIIVIDDIIGEMPVNIKTSIGGIDNGTSKLGFLFAFTDISYHELPRSINNKKFMELIKDHRADIPTKDYWYLCIDKKNPSNVLVRGCKQISNWVENANPANLLQINWKKEKNSNPVMRTYDEAYDVIINGIGRCYKKFNDNQPKEWKI